MRHIIVTLNDPASLLAMRSYSGVELLGKRDGFAFWYCTGIAQEDINKISGNGVEQEVKLSGFLLLNKPA